MFEVARNIIMSALLVFSLSGADADCILGEIRFLATDKVPVGWLLAHGQLLRKDRYPRLFSAIGTTYGSTGLEYFGLPDLRGRSPMGAGEGPGRVGRIMGMQHGDETVSVGIVNLPTHTHSYGPEDFVAVRQDRTSKVLVKAGVNRSLSQLRPVPISKGLVEALDAKPIEIVHPVLVLQPVICVDG